MLLNYASMFCNRSPQRVTLQAAPWQKGCGEGLSKQVRKPRDVREGIPDLGPVYQGKTDLKLKERKS